MARIANELAGVLCAARGGGRVSFPIEGLEDFSDPGGHLTARDYQRIMKFAGSGLGTIRRLMGINQATFAKTLGRIAKRRIAQPYVSRVERGVVGLSFDRWLQWCEALELDARDVLSFIHFMLPYLGKQRKTNELVEKVRSVV